MFASKVFKLCLVLVQQILITKKGQRQRYCLLYRLRTIPFYVIVIILLKQLSTIKLFEKLSISLYFSVNGQISFVNIIAKFRIITHVFYFVSYDLVTIFYFIIHEQQTSFLIATRQFGSYCQGRQISIAYSVVQRSTVLQVRN